MPEKQNKKNSSVELGVQGPLTIKTSGNSAFDIQGLVCVWWLLAGGQKPNFTLTRGYMREMVANEKWLHW